MKVLNKPIDMLLDGIEWKPIITDSSSIPPSDIPVATHEGILRMYGLELRVYQLSNGIRVINEEDLIKFFEGE
jgi:hypothetical protein